MFRLVDIIAYRRLATHLSGKYRTSFHGSGIEFADLREYTLGDDARMIDWNTSAKTGRIFTRTYEEDRSRRTLFVLDTGIGMYFASGERRKIDTLTDASLLLAFSSAMSRDAFGTLFFDSSIRSESLPYHRGIAHTFVLQSTLERIRETPSSRVSSLDTALRTLYHRETKNTLIFIMTDSLTVPDSIVLKALARKNECIMVRIADSFEDTLGTANIRLRLSEGPFSWYYSLLPSSRRSEAYRRLRSERIVWLRDAMLRAGVGYIELDERTDMYKAFSRFFLSRRHG